MMHHKLPPEFLCTGNYGIDLIESLKPENSIENLHLPSVRQCVGTNRLWGANLGLATYLDLAVKSQPKEIFQNLAVLSRTYLVLDDHLKDEFLDEPTAEFCNLWLSNVRKAIKDVYELIGEEFNNYLSLVKSGDDTYQKKIHAGAMSAYRSSIDKSLIFFVPIRTNFFKNNSEYYDSRIGGYPKSCKLIPSGIMLV